VMPEIGPGAVPAVMTSSVFALRMK
jgi:hypothetical protein